MQFGRIWTLRGANRWAVVPVIEAELLDASAADAERLLVGIRDFQTRIGWSCRHSEVRPMAVSGGYRVVFDYDEDALALGCLYAAFEQLTEPTFDLAARVQALRELSHEVRLGPSTRSIFDAAIRRGIPASRLNDGGLIQLGWGTKLKRVWTAETDDTPIIAEIIAKDKELTRKLLRGLAVPVPDGRPVVDADDAWAAAEEIGLPVVIKPQDGNQGRGVATNLTSREQVLAAYAAARSEGESVIVESYLPGSDHRLLVVGGKLIAASRREPAHVIGDGTRTIRELVAEVNTDPRRSDGHATPLSWIKIDTVALGVLADQGYTPDSLPPAGQKILIRRNANLSTGGTAEDVTDRVHPSVAAHAIDAAKAVGLDVAGIDVVCEDVSRPLREQNGGIVEVNAGPGLRMHLEPSAGQPRDVGAAIVESLFPPEESGRIPVVAVTGTNGKTTTARLIAHLAATVGQFVGLTCTDGIYLNGRRTETRDCSGPQSARTVLANTRVETAVLETARGGILREGLGFDRADITVVTNIGKGDHLGLRGIDTLEELAEVKRVVPAATAATGCAILNAADPLVAAMAGVVPGRVLFFAVEESEPSLANHRQQGGLAAFVREGTLILAEGSQEIDLLPIAEVPATYGGRVGFQIENVLAAAATAWQLGLPFEAIREGLRTFTASAEETPGRFNVFEVDGATIVVDYAHNPSAVAALVAGLDAFPHPHRSLVFSASDRREEDLVEMGRIAGDAFDRIVLFTDTGRDDREDGALTAVLRNGLAEGSRIAELYVEATEVAAIDRALADIRPGQLVVIGVEAIDESLDFVRSRLDLVSR